MNFQEIKEQDGTYILHTYGRVDVALVKGKNARAWDAEGKEYLDFTSGIGVNALGYSDPLWAAAVAKQAGEIQHLCNYYYSPQNTALAQELSKASGMAQAFFCNSGAESNECAVKVARKYGEKRNAKNIVTLKNSFHGRTLTTLAATGQEVFHRDFLPLTEGFLYAEANDLSGVGSLLTGSVCAVLIETVQGEGGVVPLEESFVQGLSALCREKDVLLMIDEVQTGVGRTGALFCFQQYGVQPDAVSFAKGIAGGLPMGGFLVNEKCRHVFAPGDHASTFGGNPISAAAACAVLDILDDGAIRQVNEKGQYLRDGIEALGVSCLGKTRGLGLMIGVEVQDGLSNKELCAHLNEAGLLSLTAGPVLRFLPPLTITKDEMDKGLAVLKAALS